VIVESPLVIVVVAGQVVTVVYVISVTVDPGTGASGVVVGRTAVGTEAVADSVIVAVETVV
jgi:hypothetical protein